MDILTYINRMNQIYGNGPAPAPRYNTQQYLQGGRVGYQGGQLVEHGPGRQGYNGEPKVSKIGKRKEARTTELSREEILGVGVPSRKKGITGDKLKWYNDFHFNNPESPYHNTTWEDLPGKRFGKDKKIQWASKELNERYKTHVNQIQEYNKLTKQGWVPASDYFEKNGIDNWKLQALTREKQLTRNQWFNKNIQIKKIHTAVGGASRSYWIKEPDAKITKDFVKQFSFSDEKLFKDTQKNINDLWGHEPFKKMYLNGQYPKLTEVSSVFDMTNSQAATATRRIAQLMGGTTFSNAQFKNVPLDKKAAKGMLEQFSKEKWETPYAHANRRVDTAILEENLRPYKGNLTLQTYRRRAIEILKNNNIPIMNKKGKEIITPGFNINEITGLSSGAGNKTFTSTQFINLMEGQLNQEGHARLMREYKKYEGLLNEALSSKKGTVYHKFWKQEGKEHTARELINKWKQYRTNWTNALPEKLKSSVVKGGLPGFSLDQNAATKLFGQKRLNQLVNDLKLPIVKEMEQKGYLKTWGEELGLKKQQKLMSETPVLKELVDNPDNVIRLIKRVGCPGKAAGGRVGFAEAGDVDCYSRGMNKIQTGKLTTAAEKANFTKLAQTLGPDGWQFLGLNKLSSQTKGPVASILRSVAKKLPKTAGALAKTGRFLFNPVEMGTLPLFLAAEGLYANYADKRDLKKALDQMDMPQEEKDAILEGFRQEARDVGGVGLETWAIDQPNVDDKLAEKFGGMEGKARLYKDVREPIAIVRQQDALAKEIKQQEIEKRRKEAYENAIGRNSKRPIEYDDSLPDIFEEDK